MKLDWTLDNQHTFFNSVLAEGDSSGGSDIERALDLKEKVCRLSVKWVFYFRYDLFSLLVRKCNI